MAFVSHSFASSSYFIPFFQILGFGFLEPKKEKEKQQTNKSFFFLMRKKTKVHIRKVYVSLPFLGQSMSVPYFGHKNEEMHGASGSHTKNTVLEGVKICLITVYFAEN